MASALIAGASITRMKRESWHRLFCFAMSFDYKSKRWLRLRASVLREAGYRCQYAKRYGKRIQATTVHHIWPAEDFPEYALERWNLIALSTEAHNRMHDRATGRLTDTGEQLRRRTIPPRSSIID